MPAINPISAISPMISWEKDGEIQSLPWRSENNWTPPKRTVLADDTMTADIAYRLAVPFEDAASLKPQRITLKSGKTGRLHIAIECHACFDWLFPVLELFRRAWPEVDVDIRAGLAFEALPALNREEVDLVISSDPVTLDGYRARYAPLQGAQ